MSSPGAGMAVVVGGEERVRCDGVCFGAEDGTGLEVPALASRAGRGTKSVVAALWSGAGGGGPTPSP